jgi:methionyl-tRNA formyltransferase
MHSTPPHVEPPHPIRVLFFGMRGVFSLAPLVALLDAGVDVRAVLLPGYVDQGEDGDPPVRRLRPRPTAGSTLPLLTAYHEPSIASLAWEREIPVLQMLRERDPRTIAALAAFAPELACVACWPRRMPPVLLALPPAGFLNLHPSLLPAHRGPAPLFWTLRLGDAQAGVTVHLMDETLDGGSILAQEAMDLPDGITGTALEERSAKLGGRLLVATLTALGAGAGHPIPQADEAKSYEPMPAPGDFVVTPDRPARWAFNFLRAAGHWGGPLTIAVSGQTFAVRAALGFTSDGELGEAYHRQGSDLWLQCTPGVLRTTID